MINQKEEFPFSVFYEQWHDISSTTQSNCDEHERLFDQ
jgi:hypothetical protein